MWFVRTLLVLLAVALLGSCFKATYYRGSGSSGSCSGACDHYLSCKGSNDKKAERKCLRECQAIFVDDGEVDRESLKDFEDLQCEDAVAFVDG